MKWLRKIIADWLYSRKAIRALETDNQVLRARDRCHTDSLVEALNRLNNCSDRNRTIVAAMRLADGLLSTKQPEEAQRQLRLALISMQERF